MNINEYPVNFGYLEQTTLNGKPYTHRGNDYPLRYEPVVVVGTVIGISGETGLVSGPHVHAQAGRDEWAQQTIDPTPYVGQPGTVVKTGTGSQWGNYVCLRVGDVNVFYCHLSEIKVQVGQEIGEEDMQPASYETANIYAQTLLFRDMGRDEWDKYHKDKTRDQLFDDFRMADERGANLKRIMESDNKNLDAESLKLKQALKEFLD